MSDPDVMLRVRVREVIAQWVTGEACDQIIEQALQSAAAVPSELREKRVIGYAVAKAQPARERDRLFAVLRERIIKFAASRVGPDHADDIANMSIETLIGKYPEITRLDDLMPLTTTIAMNHVRHLWRRKTGEVRNVQVEEDEHFASGRDPEEQAILRDLIDRMIAAVRSKRYKEKCRKVLGLVYNGVPYEEIREVMGVKTMATLYTWVHRCHNELRACLGGTLSFGEGRPVL
jgi:DNA-directed RNA polymerase specialized sigma24 family protein